MPIIALWFRQVAFAPRATFRGVSPPAPAHVRRMRADDGFQLPLTGPRDPACGLLPLRKRDRDDGPGRTGTRPRGFGLIPRMAKRLPKVVVLFRLSAPSGPTHNRGNNEDGSQGRHSLAVGVEG